MATEQDHARILLRKLYLSTKVNFKVYISPLRQLKIHLRQMLRQYKQWHQVLKYRKNWWNIGTEKKRFDEFERYIVHYLLEICFWVSYGDSDVVSDLLSIFYETEGHFEEIFCATPVRLLDSKKYGLEDLDKIVRNPWSRERMVEIPLTGNAESLKRQNERRITYFIKNAFKDKLLFRRIGEHWLIYKMKTNEVTTHRMFHNSDSLLFTDPDKLSKFIEHGLFANADKRDKNVGRLLTDIFIIWKSGGFYTNSSDPSHSCNKALKVAYMFLGAVKCVDISVMFQGNHDNVLKRSILKIMNFGPQKLQYLCRWQIRKQLCDCEQLPDGISLLPIPKLLQKYLQLRSA